MSSNKTSGRRAVAKRRTRGTQPLARATAAKASPARVNAKVSLRDKLIAAIWSQRSFQPPTVRICMVEVAEAEQAGPGKLRWLSDFVCFRLYPTLKPHVFRKSIHVVPRDSKHDVADYAIGLRLFHEGENHA